MVESSTRLNSLNETCTHQIKVKGSEAVLYRYYLTKYVAWSKNQPWFHFFGAQPHLISQQLYEDGLIQITIEKVKLRKVDQLKSTKRNRAGIKIHIFPTWKFRPGGLSLKTLCFWRQLGHQRNSSLISEMKILYKSPLYNNHSKKASDLSILENNKLQL